MVAQDADAGAANTLANGSTSATTSTRLGQGGATTTLSANVTLGGRAMAATGGVMQTSSSGATGATGGAWRSSSSAVGGSAVVGAGSHARSMAGSGTAMNSGAGGHSSTAIENGGSANGGSIANQAGSAGVAGAALSEECFPSVLRVPNVVVRENTTPIGGSVGGILWVGGNATVSGYSVGAALGNSCSDYGLVVGGDLSGQVNAGQTAASIYGSTANTTVTACALTDARVVDFGAVSTTLLDLSARLKALPANGDVTRIAGITTLTGPSETLNVFHLTAAELLQGGRTHFGVPTSSTVLVNISGESVHWSASGFLLPGGTDTCDATAQGNACTKILYNLYEATSVDLTSIEIYGSVLAPKATLSGAHASLYGQAFVGALLGQIEYHPFLFGGCLRP